MEKEERCPNESVIKTTLKCGFFDKHHKLHSFYKGEMTDENDFMHQNDGNHNTSPVSEREATVSLAINAKQGVLRNILYVFENHEEYRIVLYII